MGSGKRTARSKNESEQFFTENTELDLKRESETKNFEILSTGYQTHDFTFVHCKFHFFLNLSNAL